MNARRRDSSEPRRYGRRTFFVLSLLAGVIVVGLVLLWLGAWSMEDGVDATYGKREGLIGGSSVNGTGVLAGMFEERGYYVRTWRRLSPTLEKYDVIVWAPDNFMPPTPDHRQFLEEWLADGYGRTLIYIGRDYDAEIHYWRDVQPHVVPVKAEEVTRRRALAKARHDSDRMLMPDNQDADWFKLKRDEPKTHVKKLDGPWAPGVDAAKTNIELEARFELPDFSADTRDVELLLESDNQVLVAKITDDTNWPDGKIIVVTNGSFLLNYPLVNHEHRKLAGRLIDECEPADKAVFLESGMFGPSIMSSDGSQGGLADLLQWPLDTIVYHLLIVGIVVCLALAPIFGRPKQPESEPASDFGRHIGALGELLARTNDIDYAKSRITHYTDRVRRDSGVSHGESRAATKRKTPAAVLEVEVISHGGNVDSAADVALRHRLETMIVDRKVGKAVSTTSGLGKMNVAVEVEIAEVGKSALRSILKELGIDSRASIFQRGN